MLLVGLTGGIASGKTLVRTILQELGARTIDADQISRELVAPHSEAWEKIAREFGENYLLPDGNIDRKAMAELIFSDEKKRKELEAIIHPMIADEIARRIEEHVREAPDEIVVVDAALMIEVGRHENFDKLIIVYANEEMRVSRLMKRDDLTRHEAYRRILSQMALEAKLGFADYVIDNSGPPEKTRQATVRVYQKLAAIAAGQENTPE